MSSGSAVDIGPRSEPFVIPARWLNAWVPIIAALACGVVLTGLWIQVVHPFIRHDDWPYSLPATAPGTTDLWLRNLYEGRWLNYVAWWIAGRHVTPALAAGTFVVLHGLFTVGFVRLLPVRGPGAVFVLTTAVFASPLWVELVYWPATLSASMAVLAAAVWTLPLTRHQPWAVAAWTLGFTVLAVLSYAPIAGLIFLALIVHERHGSYRRLVLLSAWFVGSYAAAVLVVYTLNWLAFGEFGIVIPGWRRPNELADLQSLRENVALYGEQVGRLWDALGPAIFGAAIAAVWALLDRRSRPRIGVAALALFVVAGVEAGLTLVSGVVIGTRASPWAWIAVCLPGALLLGGARRSRIVGMVSLAIIATVGLVGIRANLAAHHESRVAYDGIAAEVARTHAETPDSTVVLWMEPAWRSTAQGLMTATTLRFMIYDAYHIAPRWCAPAECAEIAQEAARDPTDPVFRWGELIVIQVPRPPPWL